MSNKKKLAVFASGSGTNTRVILEYFQNHPSIEVVLLVCNKQQAGVINVASEMGIPSALLIKKADYEWENISPILHDSEVDFIVLAGFLLKVPDSLVGKFKGRMINIHPSLLPNFGGKGMYGMYVHQAVKEAGVSETGITIHFVDEVFDNGEVIFQAKCEVLETDTAEDIQKKVQVLEHKHFPKQIEKVVTALG